MTALPYLLLASTLLVRWLLAHEMALGFYVDLASVPLWLTYYASKRSWPLLAVPVIFAGLDVQALRSWWRA